MISNSSKYAIKAVLFLAYKTNSSEKLMAKEISDTINVPKAYIAKLLQKLSKANIISSTRGPKGGFFISKENKTNSVMDIIETIDENRNYNACILDLKNCNVANPCSLHKDIYQLKTALLTFYRNKTIEDLASNMTESDLNFTKNTNQFKI